MIGKIQILLMICDSPDSPVAILAIVQTLWPVDFERGEVGVLEHPAHCHLNRVELDVFGAA